jgi:ribose-phosphate pyrophosphokinase
LNLSPGFEPFGPGIQFKSFTFPGGEPHIKLLTPVKGCSVRITCRICNFADLGLLLMASNALRLAGARELRLLLPYFPAARQDRQMIEGEPLSVKVYAQIINSQEYSEVLIFDPHSEVTPALVDRVRVLPNYQFVKLCLAKTGACALVAPDGGAQKKIYKLAQYLGSEISGLRVIECGKQRDVSSGALTGFKVYAEDLAGKDCLVVDDICDGGATFVGLAQALRQHNAGRLHLAVSHGIFSKGIEPLASAFDTIFTSDSFYSGADPRLTVIRLGELLSEIE